MITHQRSQLRPVGVQAPPREGRAQQRSAPRNTVVGVTGMKLVVVAYGDSEGILRQSMLAVLDGDEPKAGDPMEDVYLDPDSSTWFEKLGTPQNWMLKQLKEKFLSFFLPGKAAKADAVVPSTEVDIG